jgi:hypothetical protein
MGCAHPEDAATFKDQLKIPPKRQAKAGGKWSKKSIKDRTHQKCNPALKVEYTGNENGTPC